MTEKTKNVFEQLQESLALIAEQLSNANDALYVVATETMDLKDMMETLISKLDAISITPTKATAKTTETLAAKKPEAPTFSFEKLRKETK